MRRFVVIGLVWLSFFGPAGPAAAQESPSIGDSGPASGEFGVTDEACGFGSFTDDTYTATLLEDSDGAFIEIVQGSTGDTGRFRSDADGNLRFESDGDEEYVDIQVDGDRLSALYRYTSGGCTQEWITDFTMPPGFVEALIAANRAPEPEPEPEPETSEPETSQPETSEPASVTSEPGASGPETSEPTPEISEPASQPATVDDDGFDWVLFGFLGLLLLFLVALFLLLWRRRDRPARLYRADSGGDFELIERTPDPAPTPSRAGPPGAGVIVVDDDPVPDAPPPPAGDCIPEREEFELAQEAKDDAYAAGEQADRELAQARDHHGRLQAATTNPLGDHPPELQVDESASESEQARQQRVHELNLAEWQKLEDEAAAAKAQLPDAEAALEKARADRHEAWQDFQRMRSRLEAARVALNNCDGSAGPPDDEEPPPPPDGDPGGGTETGGGPPGVIDEPPPTSAPEPEDDEEGCTKGEEKDGRVVSSTDFQVLGTGSIEVEIGTSAWSRHGRAFTPAGFDALDTSTVEDLSEGIEQERVAVRIAVRIPTDMITVKCVQVLECDGERFVDSGRTRKVVERTKGGGISVLPTGADGGIAKSKDKRDAGRMVEKAKARIETLRENEEAAGDHECD